MKRKPFYRLTPVTIWQTIFPNKDSKWMYIGYGYNLFNEGTEGYEYIEAFFRYVDSKMRPWWCPKTLLRLLHLLGNDNSVVRVRWWWAHNLYRRITKEIFITDVKTKWSTLRVYGYFTDEINQAVLALEKKVNPLLK